VARFYCTSLFDPNPNDPFVNYANDTSAVVAPMVRNLPIAETQNNARTKSLYAFDSITLTPQLIVNLGARYDIFSSKVTPGQPITATETFSLSRKDELFNYQAGLVFKPTVNTSLYASYSTAATPPNSLLGEGQESNALGTTNTPAAITLLNSLKVEKTRSYEIGAKANVFDEHLALAVAAFQTDTDNARVTGSNNTVEFVGKRRIRGAEFTASGKIFEGLTVFGGYTYLDAEIVDGGFSALTAPAVETQAAKTVLVQSVNTGRQATQTAKHSASLSTDWQIDRRFSIGGGAYYTSRVFGGYADNRSAVQNAAGVVTVNPATRVSLRSIPSYVRLDAHAAVKLTDSVDLAINVQNLTNKTYFTRAFTAHYATIAPGRSAFATLNLRF
jgi:catecholate siderophore receptor